jgi:hypothetical protein
MADKKEKEFKEYVVNVKSVGSQLSYKGKPVILNNGLSQSILKALFNMGMRSITKKVK